MLESGDRSLAIREGYETICRWIQEAATISPSASILVDETHTDSQKQGRLTVHSLILDLKETSGPDWLQSVASLLGMLMHFSIDDQGSHTLVNHRRPHRPYSTYPTSPAVAKYMGDRIVANLLKQPIPNVCRSAAAERYAERALHFRILDPSMESGQLLIEVALAIIRQVHRQHSQGSKPARYLARALLEKLSRDCLWGIDRNELAIRAVNLLFQLLGSEFGIQALTPSHLFTADTFDWFNRVHLLPFDQKDEQGPRVNEFDGVINNPPWGETLSDLERKRLRSQFSTLEHRSDTYVAFSELAIRCLRKDGILALILPSQVIASRYATRLRELLLSRTELDEIILLPHSAFAVATVRGLIFLGRAKPTPHANSCRITIYSQVKRFDAIVPARSFILPQAELEQTGKGSWPFLLNLNQPLISRAKTLRLGNLALIASGVQAYGKGRGIPSQTDDIIKERPFTSKKPGKGTVPAIRGRDVLDFRVGEPEVFMKYGKWLARMGKHDEFRRSARIFLRELCRRDGKITSAVARDGYIPLHGVLTIVPKLIDAYSLVGILNSGVAARYARNSVSFSKVDFQKITIGELREMPIPVSALSKANRLKLGLGAPTKQEIRLSKRLSTLARRLSRTTRMPDATNCRLQVEMDNVVLEMYSLSVE